MTPEREQVQQAFPHAYLLINEFIIWHLRRVYERFEGDLEAALILGEIAHFNVHRILMRYPEPSTELTEMLDQQGELYSEAPELNPLVRYCNALSISAATGIPRETVRRKIKWLEQRGWISKDDKGRLSVTKRPSQEFRAFNEEMVEAFLLLSDRVNEVLERKR
ncbi:MAG: hypothetical protein Kow0065_23660 [Methylomicrobium sp.]